MRVSFRAAARRALLWCGLLLLGPVAAIAAEPEDGLWRSIDETAVVRTAQARQIVPQRYLSFALDLPLLQQRLDAAPLESGGGLARSAAELVLPRPDGSFERFRIVESPIMESALAAKFPDIRTYLGQGLDDPSATARLDISAQGLRAQVIGWRGTYYVDPYQPGDRSTYVVYRKADSMEDGEQMHCAVTGAPLPKDAPNFAQRGVTPKVVSGATLRTYRLAVAATGEYTTFHGGTVADAMAAIVTTMNRVNGVYERELSVRMVLVANNDLLIYTNGASDPYTNDDGFAMLGENQTNVNTVIGSANYDVGHVVSTGGGGVASLGSVCSGTNKARGVTGSGSPVGDAFDVDYVAHEIGHQFAGNHTFNGSGGNCSGGNRNGNTAYETGSGITIQAYAGICGADNLQPNSEDYFHRVSLNEMLAFTTTGGGSNCGATSATGNTPPAISTTAAYTIPQQTPFELTASGSDANGDTLTYLWEQFDRGQSANAAGVIVDAGQGPLFRSFAPTLAPTRTFPSLRWILNNANVAPATAPLPGTTSPGWLTAEVLPSVARTLNFRVTARDNRAGGGGTNEASTAITVSTASGPFRVTTPNTAVSWAAGSSQTVTWDVAGTAAAPINTASVRIRLSLDGGYTWPTELLASTANDGSETVTIPAGTPASEQARIRVEAVGNIFFDVSDASFSITGGNTPPNLTVSGGVSTRQGSPTATAVVASVSDAQDAAGSLAVSVSGAPPELALSASNSGGSVSLSATAACELVAPGGTRVYPVQLTVTDSAGASRSADVNISVSRNLTPTLGTYANQTLARGASATVVPSAPAADGNDNLAGASVIPTSFAGGGTVSIAANGSVTINVGASTPFGTYPITAEIADSCGAVEQRRFDVVVASTQPDLSLAATAVTTGNGLIEPNECNQFNLTLRNTGTVAATGVSATVSTSTPNVTITQDTSSFADIAANGGEQISQTPFQISSSNSLVCFTNIDLQVNVTYGGGGSPFSGSVSLPVGQAGSPNYQFSSGSASGLPGAGSLVAGSQADDAVVSLTVPAGFNFSVYDTAISGGQTLRASTNGNLQLVSSGGSNAWENSGLPTAGSFPAALPTLLPFWDDLDTRTTSLTGGGIYTELLGTAPNRRWRVEWRAERINDAGTTPSVNFAVEFLEGTSRFEFLYASVGGSPANGGSATVGVQAANSGTRFSQHSLNQAVITSGLRLSANLPTAVCSPGSGPCAGGTVGVTLSESGGSTAATEGGASDSYSVVLNAAPSGTVSFTASPNAQLQLSPGSLQFNAMNWNIPQTLTVTAVDDAVVEGSHSGVISHSVSGGGYDGVSVPSITVAITDNDSATVSTQALSINEGNSGNTAFTFVLQLNGQVAGGVSLNYATRADSASAGSDFTAATGTVNFDGSLNPSRSVTVQVLGDTVAEADEHFFLDLVSGNPAVLLSPASVQATILNDDLSADLRVQLQRSPGPVLASGAISYTLRVENLSGTQTVVGARVQLNPASALGSASWTCTAQGSSSCGAASGSGAIDRMVNLAPGSRVDFVFDAVVDSGAAVGSILDTNASVSPPAGLIDPQPGNNSARTRTAVGSDGVFFDGFEEL
jgi:hypothetical protein